MERIKQERERERERESVVFDITHRILEDRKSAILNFGPKREDFICFKLTSSLHWRIQILFYVFFVHWSIFPMIHF